MSLPIPLAISLVLAALVVAALQRKKRSISLPLPPGPRPLPLIGNALDMPKSEMPETFRDMCMKYGDVVHLDVLGQPMIILGSHEAAVDLLEKRSANYSDRSPSPMVQIQRWFSGTLTVQGYGPWWRRHRRAMHQYFNPNAVAQYAASQKLEAHRFARRLIDTPEDFLHHIRHYFGSSVMRVTYGIEVDEDETDYLTMAENVVAIFSSVFKPGKYLVEVFPVLRHLPSWMPGAGFKRDGASGPRPSNSFSPFLGKQRKMRWSVHRKGTARPSMAMGLMERMNNMPSPDAAEEEVGRNASAVAYAAGADTAFFMAMTLYPEVQKKAQAELMSVVGPHRLPEKEDGPSLPYIQAVIKERRRIPRYFIPKGALIIANIWAYSRDEKVYPDPERFMPERFLKDGKLDPSVRDPSTIAFGYGRRICPGMHFAETSLFMVVATVLHTLNITAPIDANGMPVFPSGKMTQGVLAYPEPFGCEIKSTSAEREALIRASCIELNGDIKQTPASEISADRHKRLVPWLSPQHPPLCAWRTFSYRRRQSSKLPLPPGPPGRFIFGNTKDMPQKNRVEVLTRFNAEYGTLSLALFFQKKLICLTGPLLYLNMFGNHLLILGSHSVAVDLLDKRSRIYADRRISTIAELAGFTWFFATNPYGPAWRRARRMFHECMHGRAVEPYRPIQEREVRRYLHRLLEDPSEWKDHARHMFSASIIRVAYGLDVHAPGNDKYVRIAADAQQSFDDAFRFGNHPVAMLPWLRFLPAWLPGAASSTSGPVARASARSAGRRVGCREGGDGVQEEGKVTESMMTTLTARFEEPDDEVYAKGAAASAYAGGSETTLATLQMFFMAMAHNVEAQERAQASSTPSSAPIAFLRRRTASSCHTFPPAQEVMRWKPWSLWVLLIAQQRRTIQRLPHPQRMRGLVERLDGKLNPDVLDPVSYIFGYGRRICPGMHFAEMQIFTVISSVLHTLSISLPPGPKPEPKGTRAHGVAALDA
ncbi:cytochrome P450 [Epithele typhae]|uniref:cytochrome P450 n=1 Tax=Epithele typhae TaxID=378194 RepID=UPI0020086F79|nr:cytochrome P450 [Epithele typhae]KAH9937827.1 cytochrome P450 [Epithele typhae]